MEDLQLLHLRPFDGYLRHRLLELQPLVLIRSKL